MIGAEPRGLKSGLTRQRPMVSKSEFEGAIVNEVTMVVVLGGGGGGGGDGSLVAIAWTIKLEDWGAKGPRQCVG